MPLPTSGNNRKPQNRPGTTVRTRGEARGRRSPYFDFRSLTVEFAGGAWNHEASPLAHLLSPRGPDQLDPTRPTGRDCELVIGSLDAALRCGRGMGAGRIARPTSERSGASRLTIGVAGCFPC